MQGRIFYGATFCVFLVTLVYVNCQDDDVEVISYTKNPAGKKPTKPPKPPPPPPPVEPKFVVQVQNDTSNNRLDPCHKYTPNPCNCSITVNCSYDDLTSQCVTENAKFSGKLTCRKKDSFYSYGDDVVCKSPNDAGNCATGKPVHAVNLNGQTYPDKTKGITYKAESQTVTVDKEKLNLQVNTACTVVQGASSPDEGFKLYGTMVEGKSTTGDQPNSCVGYPIPILQDGEYQLTVKAIAQPSKCLRIKLGSVLGAEDVDLLKLAGGKACTTVDIAFPFLVESSATLMHIKGHQNSGAIKGGFLLKFCYDCGTNTTGASPVYRASAFSLIRFGNDTKNTDNMTISVVSYPDGTEMIKVTENVDKPPPAPPQKPNCTSIPKDKPAECKKVGCEYSIVTGQCDTAKKLCAGAILGTANCIRENSYYITNGGILCKSETGDESQCAIKKVNFGQNMHLPENDVQDRRGVNHEHLPKEPDSTSSYEYFNVTTNPDSKCVDKKTSQMKIFGVVKQEWPLYEGVMIGKANSKDCLSFTVKDVVNGTYELSIKMMEPFWLEAGKRAFDIRINSQPIVLSLDVAYYVGNCSGLDLLVQFEVGFKLIYINGFKEFPLNSDDTISISFCPGGGDGVFPDTTYTVAALYLARLRTEEELAPPPPPPPPPITVPPVTIVGNGDCKAKKDPCPACEGMHNNPMKCKKAGYNYDVYDRKCVATKYFCCDMFNGDLKTFCRRPNTFYVNSGVMCKNNENGGDCTPAAPLYGVNLGSDTMYKDSTRGITYKPEGKRAYDLESKKETGSLDGKCACQGPGTTPEEGKQLYSSFMTTKKSGNDQVCITYTMPVCQPGVYEMSVKMSDFEKAENKSCFSIKIGDEDFSNPMLAGIDVPRLSGGKNCQPVEIIFPVTVKQQYPGLPNFRMIKIEGTVTQTVYDIKVEDRFELKFCSCDWTATNPNPRGSAFSLVRYGDGSVPCEVCNLYNGNENGCTGAKEGCSFDKNSQKCRDSNYVAPADLCGQHENNGYACKWEGCEYNVFTGKCTPDGSGKECDNAIFGESAGCQRQGAYYSNVGLICKSSTESSQCKSGDVVWAVNMNGLQYTSQRGIPYSSDDVSFSSGPFQIKFGTVDRGKRLCKGADPEFTKLWGTFVEGYVYEDGCLTYTIPLCQDGSYELSLLMLDMYYGRPGARCFDIKLNSIPILFSLDPARNGECSKNEMIVLFKVANSNLLPIGYPAESATIVDGKITLSFCYGKCGYADGRFIASAFSVTRFGGGAKKCDKCVIHDRNQKECEKADCEYDIATKKCFTAENAADRGLTSDDPCDCDKKGFRYNLETRKCSPVTPAFENKLGCRRQNSYYAITKQHFCKNTVETGNCTKGDTVYGINLHGRDYVDSNGIKFKKESSGMSVDPKEIKRKGQYNETCQIPGINEKDEKTLYRRYVAGYGSTGKISLKACVSYPVPLLQDGEYELTIKSFYEDDAVHKTSFDIKINDVPIAINIDLLTMGGGESCKAADIVILFLVEDSKKLIRIRGHGTTIPISNGFHLQLCNGGCNPDKQIYFQVSAFSVYRFGDDTEVPNVMRTVDFVVEADKACDAYSKEDPCKCVLNDCRYDMFGRKCVSQNLAWQNKLKCRRPNYFYTFGAHLLCKVPESQGNCSTGTTIYAVNLGGKDYTDASGTYFIDDNRATVTDVFGCKSIGSVKWKCLVAKAPNTADGDQLYGTFISGSPICQKKNAGACVSYTIDIVQDGEYELNIKATDDLWTKEKARMFDIKINNVPVVIDLDIVKLGEGQKCTAIDILILFLVDGSITKMRIKGVTTPIPISKGFQLQFCYGIGDITDPNFQVSAFSVRRFGNDTKVILTSTPATNPTSPSSPVPSPPPSPVTSSTSVTAISPAPPPPSPSPTTSSTSSSSSSSFSSSSSSSSYSYSYSFTIPMSGLSSMRCLFHKKDAVACKRDGCEYDLVGRQCVAEMGNCVDEKMFAAYGNCRRRKAFYVMSGILCVNKIAVEKPCQSGTVVYAINVGGKDFTWKERNILFKEETTEHYKDPTNVRVANTRPCPALIIDDFSQNVLGTHVTGDKKKGAGPMTWPIPIKEDGIYELTIWHIDEQWQALSKRSFDISLNTVIVVFGIDPTRIATDKFCPTNEIILLFKVKNNGMQAEVQGFPTPIPIVGGFLNLGLHFGSLGFEDPNFKISALSLVKLVE